MGAQLLIANYMSAFAPGCAVIYAEETTVKQTDKRERFINEIITNYQKSQICSKLSKPEAGRR